jgi:hypothetical protein
MRGHQQPQESCNPQTTFIKSTKAELQSLLIAVKLLETACKEFTKELLLKKTWKLLIYDGSIPAFFLAASPSSMTFSISLPQKEA